MGQLQTREGTIVDRERGLHVRQLLVRPNYERNRLWRPLLPRFEQELLRETTRRADIALVGWIAYAWVNRDHAHLVGTHEHLSDLVDWPERAVAISVQRLRGAGWIELFHHFGVRRDGPFERRVQLSNSYCAGARLRPALDGKEEEAQP